MGNVALESHVEKKSAEGKKLLETLTVPKNKNGPFRLAKLSFHLKLIKQKSTGTLFSKIVFRNVFSQLQKSQIRTPLWVSTTLFSNSYDQGRSLKAFSESVNLCIVDQKCPLHGD